MPSREFKFTFLGDESDALRAMDRIEGKVGGLGGVLQRVGETAAGFLTAQVVQRGFDAFTGFVGGSVQAATDLGESINAVERIFEGSAATILQWGENNANAFGLSQRAFNQLATPLGAMLRNAGIAEDEVAAQTINLTERAADLASVFNTDVSEALGAIQAGLRGEQDPLERYGIRVSAAAVTQRALADTGKEAADALTEEEKALARLALIFEQSDAVAGDFQATSDGLANSTRIQNAQMEEMQAKIGTKLIPVQLAWNRAKLATVTAIVDHVMPALDRVSGWIEQKGLPLWQQFTGWVEQNVIPAVQRLAAWFNEEVPPALERARAAFERDIMPALENVAKFIETVVIPIIERLLPVVEKVFRLMAEQIEAAVTLIRNILSIFFAVLRGDWEGAWNGLKTLVSDTFSSIREIIGAQLELVKTSFSAVWDVISLLTQKAWDGIEEAIVGAINRIIEGINSVLNAISALEISIPGVSIPFGPDIPGVTIGVPDIPNIPLVGAGGRGPDAAAILAAQGFDNGGVVPGPRGAARLVVAHGGETILPTHRGPMQPTIQVIVQGSVITERELEGIIARAWTNASERGKFRGVRFAT